MTNTLYELLGVIRTASKKEIEAACLKLGESCRPDKIEKSGARARFAEIEKAYEILLNDQKRLEYDREISHVEFIEGKYSKQRRRFSWGLTFLVVGVLSFIIPFFGRQFVIFMPFVLMGLHPAVVGFLFIVAGGWLLAMSRSE